MRRFMNLAPIGLKCRFKPNALHTRTGQSFLNKFYQIARANASIQSNYRNSLILLELDVSRPLKNTKFWCRGVIYYAPTVARDPPEADTELFGGLTSIRPDCAGLLVHQHQTCFLLFLPKANLTQALFCQPCIVGADPCLHQSWYKKGFYRSCLSYPEGQWPLVRYKLQHLTEYLPPLSEESTPCCRASAFQLSCPPG